MKDSMEGFNDDQRNLVCAMVGRGEPLAKALDAAKAMQPIKAASAAPEPPTVGNEKPPAPAPQEPAAPEPPSVPIAELKMRLSQAGVPYAPDATADELRELYATLTSNG